MSVLWIKRSVPDNHIDENFLSKLKRNHNVVKFEFCTVVHDASVLLMSLTLSVILVLSFVTIYRDESNPRDLAVCAALIDAVLAYKWIREKPVETRISALKSTILTIVVLIVLTPVLRSLTESTSSDSIWAICGWLLLLNVYALSRSSPALSTNTALAATIVLASRLDSSLDVFHFVLFSIETFVTLPSVFKWLRYSVKSDAWSNSLLVVVIATSWIYVDHVLGHLMLILWAGVQFLILWGIPLLFLSLQKYKDRISGPWDRAQPILN